MEMRKARQRYGWSLCTANRETTPDLENLSQVDTVDIDLKVTVSLVCNLAYRNGERLRRRLWIVESLWLLDSGRISVSSIQLERAISNRTRYGSTWAYVPNMVLHVPMPPHYLRPRQFISLGCVSIGTTPRNLNEPWGTMFNRLFYPMHGAFACASCRYRAYQHTSMPTHHLH